ncbi:MAG: chemotaxis protein CheW [Gammaproteobacteria bacterium]
MLTAAGQYLTFILAGTEYGVDILRVQEIKGWDTATEIPNTPEYVRGIINLRGTIVPIVDLRKRFHMEAVAYGNTTVVVVLKVKGAGGERTMGFVVDAVSDVYNVTIDQIRTAPDFGTSVSTEFVKGLAAVGDKMVILLDIDQLVHTSIAMTERAVAH